MNPPDSPTRNLPVLSLCCRVSARIFAILTRKTWRLLDRMQGRKPVHFLHIGKTGGTALIHALSCHRRTASHVLEFHSHAVKLSDIPDGEGVIFFLRDPISRFVSGFYSRKRQGQPRYFYPWTEAEANAFAVFETPDQLASTLSSDDEPMRRKAVAAMQGIQHVGNSYWEWFGNEAYFLSRRRDILFVGFLETMEQDFEMLKAKLDIPKEVVLPGHGVETHKSPQDLDKRLGETAMTNLKEWYREDYGFIELCTILREVAY